MLRPSRELHNAGTLKYRDLSIAHFAGRFSKTSLTLIRNRPFPHQKPCAPSYLIVVCAKAEENCPKVFPGLGERLYWPFDDPAAVEGTEVEQMEAFRRVRDEIDARLREWLCELD